MNIHFNLFYNHSISTFKETVLPALTAQQKRILAIASMVFGVLAVCFIIKRCSFKASIEEDDGTLVEGEFKGDKLNGKGKRILPN